MKRTKTSHPHSLWKPVPLLLCLLIISLLLLVILRQGDKVLQASKLLSQVNLKLLIIATGFLSLTYIASSIALQMLSLHHLIFKKTLLIQLAGGLATKIAPAGLGGLALNSRYLVKNKHTFSQAGMIAVANNVIGFIGHNILIIAAVSVSRADIPVLSSMKIPNIAWLLVGVAIIGLSSSMYVSKKLRSKFRIAGKELRQALASYRRYPERPLGALICGVIITLLHCLILYSVALSLGVVLSPLSLIFVLTIGVASASITPTPGGLGGAEAALCTALVSQGYEFSLALSIALLYRLISFWLPLLPGFFFFQLCLRRHYI